MKLSTRAFSVLSLVSLAILFSCGGGGGSDAAPEKGQLKKLSKTWVLGSFTYENGDSDQIDDANFSITFSGTFNSDNPDGPYDFDITGTISPSPLPASGTWMFASVDGNEGQIVLDDGDGGTLPVGYTISSSGELELRFTCPDGGCGFDGAKINSAFSVTGDWIFNLEPEN